MTTYATFTEDNEWEGEVWRFYIPIEGNEVALNQLANLVEQAEAYGLSLTPLNEATVDDRVAQPDDTDYLAAHTKLTGRLDLTRVIGKPADDVFDVIYKGGIRDLMEAEP